MLASIVFGETVPDPKSFLGPSLLYQLINIYTETYKSETMQARKLLQAKPCVQTVRQSALVSQSVDKGRSEKGAEDVVSHTARQP